MPTDVPTWEETTDVPAWDETKALAAPPATPRFDTSKVQLNPYQDYYAKTGLTDPTREGFGSWMSRQPPEKPSIGPAKEIGALTGWDRLKYTVQNKLESVFPGMAEKGSPAPGEVIGQTAMLLPLGMPERLGKLVLGYFAARTLEAQPEYYRQIKNELQSGDYSAAQRNAIEDVLNIGMVTGGAMSFGGKPPTGELQGPPATGAVLQRPPGAVPPPTTGATEFGQIPGVPTRGIPAPPMPDPRLVRARPVVPGTPAEPRETSIETIRRAQAKTIAQIQQLFPKAQLSREAASKLRNIAWKLAEPGPQPQTPEKGKLYAIHQEAETVLRPVQQPAITEEGARQMPAHEPSPPTGARSGPIPGAQAGEIPLTPEPGTVRLYRGQPGAGGSGSFWSTDPNYARSFGENVQFVDVPKDVADSARAAFQKTGSGTPGAHILPDEWQKKAQPMERPPEQKAQEVPDEPETVISPAVEVKGQRFIGADHGEAIINAAKAGVDATKAEHVFLTSQNRLVNRMQGKELFEKQTGRKVSKPEQGLHSEDMKAAGVAKRAAEPEKPTVPAPQDNWQVVVQTFPGKIPGFVQIIDPAQTERSKSPTIESLRAAGHEVPDFSKLPTGRYTFAQAKKLLASQPVSSPPKTTTDAAAKVQQVVTQTASEAGRRPAKEIKDELVADLRQKVMQAPMAKDAKAGEKVTTDIPGDGTFTIPNTYEALSQVLKRAKKLKTDPGKPPGVPKAAVKLSSTAISQTAREKPQTPRAAPAVPEPAMIGAGPGAMTAAPSASPEPPETHIAGFGGSSRQGPATVPVANTPQQLTKLQNSMTPGLAAGKAGVQSLLLPTAKSPEHLHAAEILGAKLGAMNHRTEATAHALRGAEKFFDRQGVHNEKLTPDKNPGIRFMSNMSQGRVFVGRHKDIADQIQKMFKDRLGKLAQAGAPLQTVRKNYFPGMWTRESRLAFNAAMEQAVKQGVIPKDADANTATPAQRAWVKARVDQFLEQGVGSDADMLAYFTKRPLKGRESFRKEKVFDDIMTAAEFGLRPVSNNPIDLVKGKLAEMDKSIMANEFFRQLKDENSLEIISPYEDVPDGWVKLNDKYGTIYGAPTVTIPEYIDKNIYEGLLDFAGKLGIKHQRSMKFPPGPGSRALGLSYQGQNFVRTRFATETSVLAHEIGHQLDHRYDLWNRIVSEAVGIGKKGVQTKGASQKMRGTIQKELRAIADLTGSRGGDPHQKEEKIAQMVEAYVHAEEMMQEAAPTVFKAFEKFIESKPELKGLADLKPGIELEKLTSEKYVGLPIMGYRIVPKATGDIVNNYLSSSIYNNKYFGGLYRAWMNTANSLNQTQLGMGSAFHAGFTTADVQVSAGALALKDIYGIVRGNRSPGDLANTLKKWTTASVQTAMTGDKVLNAWRNPDGVIDPRIAQVVKATELAGGGYRLEHGLRTYQTAQMERDWYSGHRLRAAARSPIALTELMMKPIMDILVPRQKAGVFAELAWRIIEQNPGKQLEELTPQFRQAWNRVDARLGQVRYNRLFMNNTAKNIAQGLVRAPGWTGGTIAELGGAFPDAANFFKEWKTTGRMPDNIPDRVAYTLSLLATVGTVNAALTYAFTGQAPHGMDFFAFRTGRKDKDGNDERFLLPTYVKDLLAYAKQPLTTIGHKSHPLLSVLNDVANNRDYYGYEIRDPNAPATSQAGQVAKYVISSYEPFWTRGARQTLKTGKGAARLAAPYFGTMPAPAYIVRSSIQNQISHLYHLRTGERTKPYEAREADAEKRAARDTSAMDVYMFKRLPKSDQAALARKMSPEEKARYGVAVSESTPRPAWAMQAPPQ